MKSQNKLLTQTHSKAPQSIHNTSTTNVSKQPEIMAQGLNSHGQETDYPLSQLSRVKSMGDNVRHKQEMRGKYKIGSAQYDLLVIIVERWFSVNKGSTTYSLATPPRNCTISSTGLVVNGLFKQGLIEVSGKGVHGCNIYIPSKLALEAFGIVVAA